MLTLSNAQAPELPRPQLSIEIDVMTGAAPLLAERAAPRLDHAIVGPSSGRVVRVAAPTEAKPAIALFVHGRALHLDDALRVRAMSPLPAPLRSLVARQIDVAAKRVASLRELLRVTEELALAPGIGFGARGVSASIGVSGDL
ncbi:major capsid protein [Myxococcota bacterium]|nr:major capsid protein [Myxococcota bacterium]